MINIWYTGDNHFCHARIIEYCNRPFSSVNVMDSTMIKRWNEVVKEGDIVYHVGDFGLGSYDKLKEIFDRLRGRKVIIIGNHDRSATSLRKMGWEVHKQPFVLDNDIVLTHNPIVDSSIKTYQYILRSIINICGHVHEKWKRKGNSYNVGVDVWKFKPVS